MSSSKKSDLIGLIFFLAFSVFIALRSGDNAITFIVYLFAGKGIGGLICEIIDLFREE